MNNRNRPCYCGSGKKYKYCCMGRRYIVDTKQADSSIVAKEEQKKAKYYKKRYRKMTAPAVLEQN